MPESFSQSKSKRYAGHVYLFGIEGQSRVKIGYTQQSIEQRQALLEGQLKHSVILLQAVYVDDAPFVEKQLHAYFGSQALGNEWFALDSVQIMGFDATVKSLLQTGKRMDRRDHLGDRLRRVREQRGWSQRDLARNARVDNAWIARLESGDRHNISLDAAARLASALGVSLDYLAGITSRIQSQES